MFYIYVQILFLLKLLVLINPVESSDAAIAGTEPLRLQLTGGAFRMFR